MSTPLHYPDALLRSIVETAGSAIVTIDTAGKILNFSPAGETMFGHRHEEIEGRSVSMLMTHEHRHRHNGYIARYLRTGEPHIIGRSRVLPARHKSGHTFPIRLAVGVFEDGGRLFFVGIIENLAQLHEARRTLEQTERKLQQQSQGMAMAVLCSSIAHELNQPLTGATGLLEAVDLMLEKERRPDTDPVRRHLRKAIDEIGWAGAIIRQTRQLARSGEPDRHPADLNSLVRDSIGMAAHDFATTGVSVAPDLATELPPVAVDRVQIRQVVTNLLQNAADAIKTVGGGTITVATRLDGDNLLLTVADDGAGVEGDVAGRMFDAFVTTKPDGFGLGLAVSKLLVQAHGGSIDAMPNPPRGVVISVRLPL